MTAPVVSVEGLTRAFGTHRGVEQVSFDMGPGEVFGFLGPNGAGKSTTIRLLLGLYRPTAGRMQVLGLDPARDAVQIHRRVGYLPGELTLYPRLTGREHLERFARVRRLLDDRFRDELVERFTVELDRPVRTLSKGNRQKVGLVLAFMHRPDLLVLDEPTSGLDPLLQDEFVNLVRETVADGRTVFLSSHELDEVQRVVDRVSIIKEGRIVVTDTVDGLRRAAPRTVEFRFSRAVGADAFAGLQGVRVVHSADGATTAANRRRSEMSTDVALLDLRLRRRAICGYTIGMAAYAFVIVALYPSFKNDSSLNKLTEKGSTVAALFGASGPLTTPPGWLNANLYANFVPLIVLLLTIGYGASCLAGQNEDGTLGLLATLPLTRRHIAIEKAATMVLQAVPVSLATLVCVFIGRGFDLTINTSGLIGVTVGSLLLGVDFGAIAMLVGALTGSRGLALGITSALAGAAYLLSSLAPVVSWLHPARFASPFFYAVGDGQVSHGLPLGWAGVLLGVAAVAVAACLLAFDRLDVR